MTIFEEVKALVDMPTAARHYGVEVGRNNMAVCPFHHERTPSMKLYERNFYCFGCGEHGDVISLVQELFSLTPMEAVKQLNSDFGLSLDIDRPQNRQEIGRIQREKREREAYDKWEHQAFLTLTNILWTLRRWREEFAPHTMDEKRDRRFVYALSMLGHAEFLCDEFMETEKPDRLQFKPDIEKLQNEMERIVHDDSV